MPVAFRAVHPDFTSSHGFRWPFPGNTATAPRPKGKAFSLGRACPSFIGDGLCLAKTVHGAASGGIPLIMVLVVSYTKASVLGDDADKIRVKSCRVLDVIDFPGLLRAGLVNKAILADLRYANLYGADLRGADLYGANLRYANLYGADLSGADLRGADLRGANLYGANLRHADLRYADLCYAALRYANLYGADLGGADLRYADLRYADLVNTSTL